MSLKTEGGIWFPYGYFSPQGIATSGYFPDAKVFDIDDKAVVDIHMQLTPTITLVSAQQEVSPGVWEDRSGTIQNITPSSLISDIVVLRVGSNVYGAILTPPSITIDVEVVAILDDNPVFVTVQPSNSNTYTGTLSGSTLTFVSDNGATTNASDSKTESGVTVQATVNINWVYGFDTGVSKLKMFRSGF
jgi:hypothetical protein